MRSAIFALWVFFVYAQYLIVLSKDLGAFFGIMLCSGISAILFYHKLTSAHIQRLPILNIPPFNGASSTRKDRKMLRYTVNDNTDYFGNAHGIDGWNNYTLPVIGLCC